MKELTQEKRRMMAAVTRNAMEEVLGAEGEGGDFDDAERYLRDDVSDNELWFEFEKWTKLESRLRT